MELERIASNLYRAFPRNAEKLSRELERMTGLLEETGAAVMMEIEKEKYRKDKDPERIKEYRRIYRGIRRELESAQACREQFSHEQDLLRAQRERSAQERIDYDAYRVDETIPYSLGTVLTNKKPSAFSLYDQKYEVDSWKQMLLQTCALLNRMNPMLFASLESDPDLQGRKRPYFSRDGIGLDTPAKIPDADLYVETHVSARYLKKMIANLLGKNDDVKYYEELRRQATNDFQKEYYDSETNIVATGSQASYAFALYFDLVPRDAREAVFARLLEDIEKWNYRMSCGEVAWPFLIKTLSSFGRDDVLWKMIQRDDAPGYVHMLKKWGMKTLSETWDGPGSSMNHFMFGAIQEWFMSGVVGIRQADDSIGYSEILLRPNPMPGKINHARGEYRSILGLIVSDWQVERQSRKFVWDFVIPAGTTARLEIPVGSESASVIIEKKSAEKSLKLDPFRSDYKPARAHILPRRLVTLESGEYRIVSQL